MSRNGHWLTCLITVLSTVCSSGCGSTLVDPESPALNSRNTVLQNSADISLPVMTVGQEKKFFDSRSTSRVPASSVVTLPSRQNEAFYHEVTQGETLTGIARRYGVQIRKLIEANGLETTSSLKPKQLLFIPELR
jgi:LysM repeat protein